MLSVKAQKLRAQSLRSGLPGSRRWGAAVSSALALTSAVLLLAAPSQAAGGDKTEQAAKDKRQAAKTALNIKRAATNTRIKSIKVQLRQAKRSEEVIDAELAAVQAKLHATTARLAFQKAHLVQARRQQQQVAKALAVSQKQLQNRETQLAQRMAADYRQGPVRYVSVVLGSRSMGEMVSRAHVVRTLFKYDAQLIARIKNDRIDVMRWKAQADAKAAEVAEDTQKLGAEEDKQGEETQRERAILAEARQRRAEFQQQLDDLEKDSETITARIRELEATPIGRARSLVTFTGHFIHPVDARITSGFGMRFHPILHYSRLHAGVDFGARTGTPIAAAASGIVAFSGVMHGYGNVVVLDHGGGVSTLYAHCSSRSVSVGQSVSQGQIIAHVGATGLATGPHLHFEVRKNGTPVDPMGAL